MSEQPSTPLPPSSTRAAPHERGQALPQRLRRNVATLSLVGAVLVALPVVQLLRYQSAELETLNASRARLDPVARAVHVQRGLLAHRDISAQVLGGRPALEPERQLRQTEVDGRLAAMMVALASGRWELAMGEADELHQDWRALVQQIGTRSIDSRGSDHAHRLLVEQTLQVMDLLAIATQSGSATHGAHLAKPHELPQSTLAVVQTLPRLVWQTSLLSETPAAGDNGAAVALRLQKATQIEAGLGRLLGLLETAHTPSDVDPATHAVPATSEAVLRAGAAAGAATARYVGLLRAPSSALTPDRAAASAADLQHAGRAAIQAQMQLFDVAEGSAQAALSAHSRQIAQRRALLMGGLTFLALLAAALLSRIWRGLLLWQDREREQEAARPLSMEPLEGSAGQEPAERRAQTDRLLQRLRDSGTPEAATADKQAVATQPPPSQG